MDRDFTITKQSSIVAEKIKSKQITFLQDLYKTEYKHLQNVYTEADIEPYLPLSQILLSLKSHRDPTKGLFVMIQQDGNKSLQAICLNKNFQDTDSYMDIELKEG